MSKVEAEVKEKEEKIEIEKSVSYGSAEYIVYVGENELEAQKKVYPLAGYGNNYGRGYYINLSYSRAWASVEVYEWADGWAIRGSLSGWYTIGKGYVRKSEAKKFVENIRLRLLKAEDGTPEVKEVFDAIVSWVEDKVYTE